MTWPYHGAVRAVFTILGVLLSLTAVRADPPPRPMLEETTASERDVLGRMLTSRSWARRAIGAMRLERYGCDASKDALVELLADDAWQVRAFSIRSLGRRRIAADESWFADEAEPRVLRTALRHRYSLEAARLERGVTRLAERRNVDERMLGVELGAASGDPELESIARETLRSVILRMDRRQAGALSPRIAAVTGKRGIRRAHNWQTWLLKAGRSFEVRPAFTIPAGDDPLVPAGLPALDTERFTRLEDYMSTLHDRRIDLAICLDTTASMSGELAEAQAGLDDLMVFAADVVSEFRVAIVAYRDARSRYQTRWWDFTSSIDEARGHLWSLAANGGGDTPESVSAAMRDAFTNLVWLDDHVKVLIVIGDAPPHPGTGAHCITMAKRARHGADVTTHVIQTEDVDVKHFPEIAEAGEGRCVSLTDDDALIPEVTGLTLGGAFEEEMRDFFAAYLELCR